MPAAFCYHRLLPACVTLLIAPVECLRAISGDGYSHPQTCNAGMQAHMLLLYTAAPYDAPYACSVYIKTGCCLLV
jgi:hypothetical protein